MYVFLTDFFQARATQHRLALAEAASKLRLDRVRAAADSFSFILNGAQSFCTKTNEDALPAVINTADDVLSQVYSVMEAIDSLMGAEPLTVAFSTEAPYHTQTNDDDVPVDTRREWEKGRDEYLNWEAQRIIASMKR